MKSITELSEEELMQLSAETGIPVKELLESANRPPETGGAPVSAHMQEKMDSSVHDLSVRDWCRGTQ